MRILITILALLIFSMPVYAETCPYCGAEIPPVISIQVEKNLDGSTKKWTEEVRDSHGVLLGKRVDNYTYYKDGEINEVDQKIYNSKDALTDNKTVKHYTDGKQPTVLDASIFEGEVSK